MDLPLFWKPNSQVRVVTVPCSLLGETNVMCDAYVKVGELKGHIRERKWPKKPD